MKHTLYNTAAQVVHEYNRDTFPDLVTEQFQFFEWISRLRGMAYMCFENCLLIYFQIVGKIKRCLVIGESMQIIKIVFYFC